MPVAIVVLPVALLPRPGIDLAIRVVTVSARVLGFGVELAHAVANRVAIVVLIGTQGRCVALGPDHGVAAGIGPHQEVLVVHFFVLVVRQAQRPAVQHFDRQGESLGDRTIVTDGLEQDVGLADVIDLARHGETVVGTAARDSRIDDGGHVVAYEEVLDMRGTVGVLNLAIQVRPSLPCDQVALGVLAEGDVRISLRFWLLGHIATSQDGAAGVEHDGVDVLTCTPVDLEGHHVLVVRCGAKRHDRPGLVPADVP